MSFLDSKEQVIDLVLTKYGKYQVAAGLFQPTYYAFLDDDVIYNGARGGVVETQNEAEKRIVTETPKNSFIINATGLEASKFKMFGSEPAEESLFQGAFGLSDSEPGNQAAPAFTYLALQNEISSSTDIKTIQSASYAIPQLNFDLNAFIVREGVPKELYELGKEEHYKNEANEEYHLPDIEYAPEHGIDTKSQLFRVFADNTALRITKGQTIGLLLESGGSKANDVFELEFYLVKEHTVVNKATNKITTKNVVKQLDPYAQYGEIQESNALAYYLDVDTEDTIEIELVEGFSPASGLYDNLPDSEKC
jgi:hypothetical protein